MHLCLESCFICLFVYKKEEPEICPYGNSVLVFDLKKICTVFCAYGCVIEKSFVQWITLVYILTCTGDPAAGMQF